MTTRTGLEIAVIGLAGRFPGAPDLNQYWQNLRSGVESVTFFTPEELRAAGVSDTDMERPGFVRARGVLEGTDLFDAGFFGLSPREAEITDPQHRLFLECAWQALESAGCDPTRFEGPIGVYGGVSMNRYLATLFSRPDVVAELDLYQLMIANDKDYLTTRVSYKLGLEGPSVVIQTACSTSLVAAHVACQALLNGECDLALAGGVSAMLPEAGGYLHREGMVFSPDGHCRAFAADSAGTVMGHGVGMVALKRLEDAREQGDTVHAVILGSAVNNDGSDKIGFTAPRIDGQARAIRSAQLMAEVDAESISYVEAHGTGTPLGDPIEVAALTRAFRATTDRRGFCALGSVKSNFGHLDAAAGIASLIKTVLACKHGEIPPTLHAEMPNPQIDFDSSPFYLATEVHPWTVDGPRRAGISSFGIGGTNVHMILEEAPAPDEATVDLRPQTLLLSARSEEALERAAENLAAVLERNAGQTGALDLADVAFTLQTGRRAFEHRRVVVAANREAAVAELRSEASRIQGRSAVAANTSPKVVFLFPGQGAQHAAMTRQLADAEPYFAEQLEQCHRILEPLLGVDPRQLGDVDVNRTELAQPLLFVAEYALARQWMAWGVEPAAFLGHSVGEWVAACLAGVFTLEDALRLIVQRGQLMQRQPPGAMVSIALSPNVDVDVEIRSLLGGRELVVAAWNGPRQVVVSGEVEAIDALIVDLEARSIGHRRLHTSHAFHSPLMDGAVEPLRAAVAVVPRQAPERPFLSNVTGTWIRAEEAVDPAYWAEQLRKPVRFSSGLQTLLASEFDDGTVIFLEVGPGHTLSTLTRKHLSDPQGRAVIPSLPHPKDPRSEAETVREALGRLWMAGVEPDWISVHGRPRRRVPLPTYPFERQSYRVLPGESVETVSASTSVSPSSSTEPASRFMAPIWKQTSTPPRPRARLDGERWLLLADETGLTDALATALQERGASVFVAEQGDRFSALEDRRFRARLHESEDLAALLDAIGDLDGLEIVHALGVTSSVLGAQAATRDGFFSLLALAQRLGERRLGRGVGLSVLTNGLEVIGGEPEWMPEKALGLGPLRVMPKEIPGLRTRRIDLDRPKTQVGPLVDELLRESPNEVVWRGSRRYVRDLEPLALPDVSSTALPLRDGGAYLITGGLGAMGLSFAESFVRERRDLRLALLSRTGLPEIEPETGAAPDDAEERQRLSALEARLHIERGTQELETQGDLVARLDRLCTAYAWRYLVESGVESAVGTVLKRETLRRRRTVLPAFERFYEYLLQLLITDGWLDEVDGEHLRVAEAGKPSIDEEAAALRADHPEFTGLIDLLDQCAQHLTPALAGEVEAISVLYPEGRGEFLADCAARTASFGRRPASMALAAELVARQLDAHEGERLRVLEVGGGAGSLTREVLARLEPEQRQRLEYWFTDLGRGFVLRAEERAQAEGADFMRFATLDLSRDPLAQGFAATSFDVVLALDVIHATPDVVQTFRHLRTLLRPGGTVRVVEMAKSRRWSNLIWGLAAGWWLFSDDHRQQDPVLAPGQWERVLRDAGFHLATAIPADDAGSDYTLLSAQAPLDSGRLESHRQRVADLRRQGAEVDVRAVDVTDRAAMASALDEIRARWGRVDGVIHAAGVLGMGAMQQKSADAARAVLRPKVEGTLILDELLRERQLDPDFFVLCSSISALGGAFGQADYCAANAFLDHFAHQQRELGRPVTSINWDRWAQEGMAVEAVAPARPESEGHALLGRLLHRDEDRAIFRNTLSASRTWALDEHRLLDHPVLPGTSYLEMARAALASLDGTGAAAELAVELEDVFFWSPLVVPDGQEAEVFTVLDFRGFDEDGVSEGYDFQVLSRLDGDAESGWRYVRHASGSVTPFVGGVEALRGDLPSDFESRRAELLNRPSAELEFGAAGRFGARWHCARACYFGEQDALAEMVLDVDAEEMREMALHPALLDTATGFAGTRLSSRGYLPLSYQRLVLLERLRDRGYSYARLRGEVAETFAVDVVLTAEDGTLLALVEGFTKKRFDAERAEAQLDAVGQGGDLAAAPGMVLDGHAFPEIAAADLDVQAGDSGEAGHDGLSSSEGVAALHRVLAHGELAQVIVAAKVAESAVVEDRREITDETAPARLQPSAAPSGDALEVLTRLWQEVLGVATVGIHDNFFELGGDSILGLQVVAKAKEAGYELTPSQIFERPTLAQLAAVLADEAAGNLEDAAPEESTMSETPPVAEAASTIDRTESVDISEDAAESSALDLSMVEHLGSAQLAKALGRLDALDDDPDEGH